MTDPQIGIRLYQIDEGDEMYFAVTVGLEIRLATRDYTKAVRHYAGLEGMDPAGVEGPTHHAEEELELAERLAFSL